MKLPATKNRRATWSLGPVSAAPERHRRSGTDAILSLASLRPRPREVTSRIRPEVNVNALVIRYGNEGTRRASTRMLLGGDCMMAPLSSNEMEILDQHLATLKFHLEEVANLLESRLSKIDNLASDARKVQREFSVSMPTVGLFFRGIGHPRMRRTEVRPI